MIRDPREVEAALPNTVHVKGSSNPSEKLKAPGRSRYQYPADTWNTARTFLSVLRHEQLYGWHSGTVDRSSYILQHDKKARQQPR